MPHLLLLLVFAVPAFGATLPGTDRPVREPDPVAWLEDGGSARAAEWVRREDIKAESALEAGPLRGRVLERLRELLRTGVLRGLTYQGRRVFYEKRTGSERQPKVYVLDEGVERPHLALDPERVRSDGSWALDWWVPSPDGMMLAYGMTELRSGESVLRVREVDSSLDLPDRIPRTPDASVAWLPDRTGFYYTRHPRPGSVPDDELLYHRRVFFHRLGADPLSDRLVFGEGRLKEERPEVQVSRNGRYLLITAWQGASRSELYFRDLTGDATGFIALTETGRETKGGASYRGRFGGDTLYILTDEGAPRSRILATDFRKPYRVFSKQPKIDGWLRKRWREAVPEGPFTITDFMPAGKMLAVSVLERSVSRLRLHGPKGKALREIPLPGGGTVRRLGGQVGSDLLFVLHESFLSPPKVFRYDLKTSSLSVVESLLPAADPSDFRAEQTFFVSRDGTRVSMFLVHKKGLLKDRKAPTILEACGALGETRTPVYSPALFLWLEKGGLLAVPNIRGGGEYGTAWRRAGSRDRRERSYEDLVGAGRWLIAEEYTQPGRLALVGTRHCALAAAGAVSREPGLAGAAFLAAPFTDLLRFPRFRAGRLWLTDYGDPGDRWQRGWLLPSSPLRQLAPDVRYPAVLVTVGDWDRTIDPAHGRRWAGKLMHDSSSGRSVLLRRHIRAGLERGRPVDMLAEELADRYTFLMKELNVR